MEDIDHLALRFAIQVNEKIPARYEIQMRERWISQQIVRGEKDHFSDHPFYLIAVIFLDEETFQSFFREIRSDSLGVFAIPGEADGILVEVGCEDLDGRGVG